MKRVMLFLATNLAVVLVLGVVTNLLGVNRWMTAQGIDYRALLIFSAVIGFTGSFFSLAISKWVAKRVYGIQLIDRPTDRVETWVYETVKDQARRAGVGMPEVGIYDSPEANAFATGPSRNRALVAVSTGLLRQMERREVEGVLAHEMAHVANGDMVTMTLLQGTLNTFVIFLSRVVGFALDQVLRRGEDRRGVGIGYYLGYIVCEMVLGVLASLVVMAYSRRREFRADAMAADLEGPEAMIGALRRLQAITERGGVIDNRSASLSSFKINGLPGWARWFSSHPPLAERIAALEQRAG